MSTHNMSVIRVSFTLPEGQEISFGMFDTPANRAIISNILPDMGKIDLGELLAAWFCDPDRGTKWVEDEYFDRPAALHGAD